MGVGVLSEPVLVVQPREELSLALEGAAAMGLPGPDSEDGNVASPEGRLAYHHQTHDEGQERHE